MRIHGGPGNSVSDNRPNIHTRVNSDHANCLLDWKGPYTKQTFAMSTKRRRFGVVVFFRLSRPSDSKRAIYEKIWKKLGRMSAFAMGTVFHILYPGQGVPKYILTNISRTASTQPETNP